MKNTIEIDLDSRDEYVNEYDDDKICVDLHHYIIDSFIDIKKEVVIKVLFHFKVDDEEKKRIRKMLYLDFQSSLLETEQEIKSLHVRDIFLFLVGLILFFLSYFFEQFHMNLFSEFFMVVTWVAFWEVAESFLFVRRRLVLQKKKYQKLVQSKIIVD